MPVGITIKTRRGTAAEWTASNSFEIMGYIKQSNSSW